MKAIEAVNRGTIDTLYCIMQSDAGTQIKSYPGFVRYYFSTWSSYHQLFAAEC